MPQPEVTICVLTYNRPHFLAEALNSIFAQTWNNFRIIILDNASIVDYEEVLNTFPDNRLTYIRHKVNIGAAGNFEYACKNFATTPFLMVFHDDDLMHPQLLEWQVRLLKKRPDLCWVGPRPQPFQDKIPKCEPPIKSDVRILNTTSELVDYFIRKFNLCFGHVLMRTSALKQVDLAPLIEDLSGVFDRPFLFQLMKNGKAGILLETLAFYRIHPHQDSVRTKFTIENIINLGWHYKIALGQEATFGQGWRFRFSNSYNFLDSYSRLSKDTQLDFWKFNRQCRQVGFLYWWSPLWFAIRKTLHYIR